MGQMDSASQLVMVVEDFDDTREMMRRFLEMGGCRVVEAANGREAVEQAERETPDLILMDLNMPVLDGFAAALRIRERDEARGVPIVAVTAYDSAESRAAARAVGCVEYVAKPLDFDKLMALVQRLVPRTHAQEADHAA
jgi:CheY-like chemotaxis protein